MQDAVLQAIQQKKHAQLTAQVTKFKHTLRRMHEYVFVNGCIFRYSVASPTPGRTETLTQRAYERAFGSNAYSIMVGDMQRQSPETVFMSRCTPAPFFVDVDAPSLNWLRVKYDNDLKMLNSVWGTKFRSWADVHQVSTQAGHDAVDALTLQDYNYLTSHLQTLVNMQTNDKQLLLPVKLEKHLKWVQKHFLNWCAQAQEATALYLSLRMLVDEDTLVSAIATVYSDIATCVHAIKKNVSIIPIPKDGNCFFTAVARAMAIPGGPREVRLRVAEAVAFVTPSWETYREALPKEDVLPENTLEAVQAFIMDRSHWATDFDMRIVSAVYNVHFIIFYNNTFLPLGFTHVLQSAPFILLKFVDNCHFDLVQTHDGRGVYAFENIPVQIRDSWVETCGELDFKEQIDVLFKNDFNDNFSKG